MNLPRFFIARPVATLLLTLSILLLGILGFTLLPVAPLPQVAFPTVMVSASLPGASPETMAATVATPLERSLGQIAGITEMTSTSSQSSTTVILQFALDRDINGAARDVQAAINGARSLLPSSMPSLPTYRKANPSDAPILMLALTSKSRSRGELYDLASSYLQQKIAQVNGVGEVSVRGGSLPAVRVDLQPQQLSHQGIALDTVRSAIANATSNIAKGQLDGDSTRWQIHSNSQLDKSADYRTLVITRANGSIVRLSDVARVYDAVEDQYTAGYFNQQPSVMIGITRQSDANMLETIDAIKAQLPALSKSLPGDVELHIATDRSGTIRSSLHATEETLLIAVLLVIVVVFVFLRNLHAVLIPALTLPVSLIGTFAVMYLCGYSLNNLTLMSLIIATGFVVDDAIVVLENITRHIEAGMRPLRAALQGASEVSFTVLSMTLSLIAVFIPILLMGSIVGRLFREFAVTLAVSLMISLLMSLSLTPMLCAYLLRKHQPGERAPNRLSGWVERVLQSLQTGYARALAGVMRHRLLTLLSLLLTVALNVWLYTAVPKGFFPDQDTGMLMGQLQADQNVSFAAIKPKLLQYSAILLRDPAVQSVMISTGSGGFGSRNSANLFVQLKDQSQRQDNAFQIARRLSMRTHNLPGAQLFLMPAQDLRIGGRSANATYQYSIRTDDLAVLRSWTPRVEAALKKLPQLTNVSSDAQAGGQEVMITIDRDKASALGVNMNTIDTLLNNAFSQRQVATIYQSLNQYHVVMMLAPDYTADPQTLQDIQVVTSAGTQIPLSSFASFSGNSAALAVAHQGQAATATVAFDLAAGVSLDQADQAIRQAMVSIGLPRQIQSGFQGTAKEFEALTRTMPWLIVAALAAVYIVLGVLYESYIHPLTILSTLPSAGVGALLLLQLSGMQLTVIALIGILLLIGIVKKNAIMMIDFALHAQRSRQLSAAQAIVEACQLRFRPIMMTTLAAFFGALPLALGHGGDADLRSPLGVAIAGGLALSQLLTLFTTPVVYVYLDRLSQYTRAHWRRLLSAPKEHA
ncbi:multidrug efflux RND transporter permease subunit [Aquitalea sp.]|uniref:multidrug efflux RND transporter permease subunit n=1 Tax=Aquitalea sp. TaxID=1872623 RepID=UPI00258B8E62|nr:multidrug efflux RND transporter permease subunit [Aquitalea sp.]